MTDDDSINLQAPRQRRTISINRENFYAELSHVSGDDNVLVFFKIKSGVPHSYTNAIRDAIEEFVNRTVNLDRRPVHYFMYHEDAMEIQIADLNRQTVELRDEYRGEQT